MNASGYKWNVRISGKTYYFDGCSIVCISKIKDTPLVTGNLYRERIVPLMYRITLKASVDHSRYEEYAELLTECAKENKNVIIGSCNFSSCMLTNGSFVSSEKSERAQFEMTFTGVMML